MSKAKKTLLFLGDVALLYVSLAVAVFLRYQEVSFDAHLKAHILPFSVIFIFWLIIFYITDLYRHPIMRSRGRMLGALATSVILASAISVIIFYLFGTFFALTPKTNLVLFAGVFLLLDFLFRSIVLSSSKRRGISVVMLGDSPIIRATADYLKINPQTGYHLLKFETEINDEILKEIVALAKTNKIELAVIQPKLATNPETIQKLYRLLPLGINLMNFSDFYELMFDKVPLEELEEGWFVEHISPRKKIYDRVKRLVDILFATLLGVVLSPIILLTALGIRSTSRGPAIYTQKRIGKNGKVFTIYKFRSMTVHESGPLWTEKNDSRITKFGKFLRYTHLDELPQLLNVLRGEISITGPRPERIELAEQYAKFPYYDVRHLVTPGLTGWAQINFKPSASLEEAYEKLKYDIYYIENRSITLDMLIIVRTLKYFFTNHE